MEHRYRISYRQGDSSFEVESSDKEWFDAKEKEYLVKITLSLGEASASEKSDLRAKKDLLSLDLTIQEFYRNHIKLKGIIARPDIAVLFVYYLAKIAKRDTVKTGDVQQCFADIAYPNYNKINFADILSRGKRKALLNYVNNSWSLTITGEDFVNNIITSSE